MVQGELQVSICRIVWFEVQGSGKHLIYLPRILALVPLQRLGNAESIINLH